MLSSLSQSPIHEPKKRLNTPRTLALMHGASYHGNGSQALQALANHYDAELEAAMMQRRAA